jgi:hypothetical protein
MTLQIIDCAQNSPEWHQARAAIPTASQFSAILAKGEGKMRKAYLNRLAAEAYTGDPLESYKSMEMERGHAMEAEARDLYCFQTGAQPQIVGFIRNGRKGCSPDALIGDDGILEIKTQRADLLIETLAKDEFPKEHIAQCQGALWITGRNYIDIAVYWPKMPLFVKRATRDERYIQTLATEVDRFNAELDAVIGQIRARGEAVAA